MSTHLTPDLQRELAGFMEGVQERNPGEPEFHQAVHDVAESLIPFLHDQERYRQEGILERMTEPDRVVIFRVP